MDLVLKLSRALKIMMDLMELCYPGRVRLFILNLHMNAELRPAEMYLMKIYWFSTFRIPQSGKDLVNRMYSAGYQAEKSHNPYWDKLGMTFEDPDGYRVVLQNTSWQT